MNRALRAACGLGLLVLAACTSPPPPPPFAARLVRGDRSAAASIGGELILHGVAVSPDGQLMAAFGASSVVVRDVATGEVVTGFECPEVASVAFSPDGSLLAAGSREGVLLLARGAQATTTLQGPKNATRGVRFTPDGTHLLSADADAVLWDVRKREVVSTIEGPCAAVSPDARSVLVKRAGLALVDAPTGLARWASGEPASAAAFSLDGKLVAIGTTTGVVELREAKTGTILARATGFAGGVRSLVFSPDAKLLIASPLQGDADRMLEAPSLKDVRLLRFQSGVHAFSPDGTVLASIVGAQWCVLTDVKTGAELGEMYAGPRHREVTDVVTDLLDALALSRAKAWRLVYSPDGRWFSVQNGTEWDLLGPTEVRFYDVVRRKRLALVEGSEVRFTKDSKRAVWLRGVDGIICVADAPE